MSSVWVICGGVSSEHEISVISAQNVVSAFNQTHLDVSVVYVTLQGEWFLVEQAGDWLGHSPQELVASGQARALSLCPGRDVPWVLLDAPDTPLVCDCVFPLIHGTQGEDGMLQGLLQMLNVPFVGADVLASAICMAKHVAKSLLRDADILTADWAVFFSLDDAKQAFSFLSARLGLPMFVKPSAQGSSIGVARVTNQAEYLAAVQQAFVYGTVIVERAIDGREIECSVMGSCDPVVSVPGEIITRAEFYSYDAKYVDANVTAVVSPADLTDIQVAKLQQVSLQTYRTLCCRGMARVDMFLTDDNRIVVNEVNTIPGFTDISMYPKNWQASGLEQSDLLIQLVQYAMSDFKAQQLQRHGAVAQQTPSFDCEV